MLFRRAFSTLWLIFFQGLRSWLVISSILAVFLSYRMYVAFHREIPPEIENPEVVRWLDEVGRLGNSLTWVCYQLGVEQATWPAKVVVNFGFRLLLNGIGNSISNITVRYTTVDGVPVTIFLPDTLTVDDSYPTMVYFHGGGWTWLSVDIYAGFLSNLATETKLQVAAVEYRKAPQHPFPAAFEDGLKVTEGLLKREKQFRIKPGQVILAGDGSGGNIAAAVANVLRNKILMQVLINPALQVANFQTPSYQDNANTLIGLSSSYRNVYHWLNYAGISKDFLQVTLDNAHVSNSIKQSAFNTYVDSKKYLPAYHKVTKKQTKRQKTPNFIVSSAFNDIVTDPRFSPMMFFHLEGIPNAYMITSQYDVYRDEAIMYAHRLHGAGIKVKLEHYYEGFHGFFLFSGNGPIQFNSSKRALDNLSEFINNILKNV